MTRHDEPPEAHQKAVDDSRDVPFVERRSAPRAMIVADLEIVPNQVCEQGYVTDVSQTGCRLFLKSHSLRIGQYCAVKFAHLGYVSGCVEWSSETDVGVRFDSPLHVAIFDFIVREKGKLVVAQRPAGADSTAEAA